MSTRATRFTLRGGGTSRQPFLANLLTARTFAILAAGFLLALLLGRTLPGVGLFHPEARVITKDVVITALNGQGPTPADIHGIATSDGEGFSGESEVWDATLLNEALLLAQPTNNFKLAATITYVIPRVGPETTLRIEQRS